MPSCNWHELILRSRQLVGTLDGRRFRAQLHEQFEILTPMTRRIDNRSASNSYTSDVDSLLRIRLKNRPNLSHVFVFVPARTSGAAKEFHYAGFLQWTYAVAHESCSDVLNHFPFVFLQ